MIENGTTKELLTKYITGLSPVMEIKQYNRNVALYNDFTFRLEQINNFIHQSTENEKLMIYLNYNTASSRTF